MEAYVREMVKATPCSFPEVAEIKDLINEEGDAYDNNYLTFQEVIKRIFQDVKGDNHPKMQKMIDKLTRAEKIKEERMKDIVAKVGSEWVKVRELMSIS